MEQFILLVVGGVIGGVAAAFTQVIVHRFSSRRSRNEFLRGKLEGLVSEVLDLEQSRFREGLLPLSRFFPNIDKEDTVPRYSEEVIGKPLGRLQALQRLYFPEFAGVIADIVKATRDHDTLVSKHAHLHVPITLSDDKLSKARNDRLQGDLLMYMNEDEELRDRLSIAIEAFVDAADTKMKALMRA